MHEPHHPAPKLTSPTETALFKDEAATLDPQPPADDPASSFEGWMCQGATPAAGGPSPLRIPGYEVLGELGRGGMGAVYRARDVRLNRPVALKVVLGGSRAGAAQRARFLAEAEAIAAVRHPGVVEVYEFGTHDEQPYFAMEYCPGGSLADRLAGTPLQAPVAASLVAAVARAVQAAHQAGIIHRDIKPGNILLQRATDVAARGGAAGIPGLVPKVTDFGLAKRVAGGDGLTATGSVLGTPSYMAPEQASGDGKRVGPAADVYALGAVLYECLTGRPPFRAATALDTVLQVLRDEPVPVRRLNPKAPRDLETVCQRCLTKIPARRYPSADALADDLDRFLRGEPVKARPVGPAERAARWARRRPAIAGLLLLVAASTLSGAAAVLHQSQNVRAERDRAVAAEAQARLSEADATTERDAAQQAERAATAERDRAERQLLRSDWLAYTGRLTTAMQRWDDKHADPARAILDECPAEWRGWEYGLLRRAVEDNQTTTRVGSGDVTGIGFARDGRLVTADSSRLVVWGPGNSPALVIDVGFPVTAMAIDGTGRLAVAGGPRGEAGVWDIDTGARVCSPEPRAGMVRRIAFSPDGRRLAVASRGGRVSVWDARTGVRSWDQGGHLGGAICVAWSPDGTELASGGETGNVLIWDADSGRCRTADGHGGYVMGIAYSPDGQTLVTSACREIAIRRADTGKILSGHLWDPLDDAGAIAFSSDGTVFYTGGTEYVLRVWNPVTGARTNEYRGHGNWITALAVAADGRVATASKDGTAKVWDVSRPQGVTVLPTGGAKFAAGRFSSDGTRVVVAGHGGDGGVVQEFLTSGPTASPLMAPDPNTDLLDAAVGLNGHKRAVAADGSVVEFPPAGPKQVLLPPLDGVRGTSVKAALQGDGRLVARATPDGTVQVTDLDTGRELWTANEHKSPPQGVRFDPMTGWLAVGYQSGRFDLLEPGTGRRLYSAISPHGPNYWVYSAAVSPDRQLVAVTYQYVVGLWDIPTGRWVGELAGHTSFTTAVAFSADGTRVVSGGYDSTARVWDVATRTELRTLRGHTEPLFGVEFSPDGQRLLTSAADGTARLWDGSTPDRDSFLRTQREAVAARLARVSGGGPAGAAESEIRQLTTRLARLDGILADGPHHPVTDDRQKP